MNQNGGINMNFRISILVLMSVLLVYNSVQAGTTVTVPNTFVAGEIATALGVNDNFTALLPG